jgi:hypothetical protein
VTLEELAGRRRRQGIVRRHQRLDELRQFGACVRGLPMRIELA